MGSRWFASRNFGAGVKKRFSTPVRPQAICEHSVKGQGAFRLPVTTTSATNEEMILELHQNVLLMGQANLSLIALILIARSLVRKRSDRWRSIFMQIWQMEPLRFLSF